MKKVKIEGELANYVCRFGSHGYIGGRVRVFRVRKFNLFGLVVSAYWQVWDYHPNELTHDFLCMAHPVDLVNVSMRAVAQYEAYKKAWDEVKNESVSR